ncbi:MAG: 3',5'-cyclic-nucleotide phosphodiesterase [Cytophaga sp.]|nr:3',5'-cyclic-nucleotide phosphodiesterase [Undibacterium sp.]
MQLKVLGCSGGIGGPNLRTTSLLIDNDILIDAGTGVAELNMEQLACVDHVFITHSHLDHLAFLPFLLDSVGHMRNKPLIMYSTQATENIIKNHIFNWEIWPDFSEIPNRSNPYLKFNAIQIGQEIVLNGRKITALPANHTVPAVGYQLDSGSSSLVFTGDTTTNDELWKKVNQIKNLRYLIIETAFSNDERRLAELSRHLCPSMLCDELLKLQHDPEIFITHLKLGQSELIMREIAENCGRHSPRMLEIGQLLEF